MHKRSAQFYAAFDNAGLLSSCTSAEVLDMGAGYRHTSTGYIVAEEVGTIEGTRKGSAEAFTRRGL